MSDMMGMGISIWEIVKASIGAMFTVAVFYAIVQALKKIFGKKQDEDRDFDSDKKK